MIRKLSFLLVAVLMLWTLTAQAYEFESDRMYFGDIDFGGATVTIVLHFNSYERFMEGGVEAGKLEEAKKLFNIGDIQFLQVGWGEMGETCLNRYMSGESTWDFWRLPHAFFFDLATKGAFFDVGKILPESYFDSMPRITAEKDAAITRGLGAQRYHFSIGVPDDYGHSLFVCFNKDMFEREGLPDPYELYEEGRWDWETVEDLAIRLTKDTDGDGVIDQFGFHWINPTYYIFANGGQIVKLDENGDMVFAMQDEAVYEALRTYHRWQNVLGLTTGDWQMLDFEQGKAAMAWMPFYEIHQVDYEFDFGVLPLPKGPHVDECVFPPGVGDGIFIPANAANPLAMVALDNFLWPVETYYEELDNAIRAKVSDVQAYQVFQEAIEKWDGRYASYFNFLGAYWDANTPFGGIITGVNDGRSPASVVAEYAQMAQAKIDEIYGQ